MGTSNILGGLLMGLGQSRAQIQKEEFEREQASLEKMRGLAIGLMDKVPPDVAQELAALSMELLQGKMNSRKVWERLQPLILGTKPTPVPGTGRQVPPRTTGGGPGPQLRQIAPPPAAMGGGPVAAGAEGMPLRPPPAAPAELGLTPDLPAMPEATIPGFTMPSVIEQMGPFARKAAMEEQGALEKLRATERIKQEEALRVMPEEERIRAQTHLNQWLSQQVATRAWTKEDSEDAQQASAKIASGFRTGEISAPEAHRMFMDVWKSPQAASDQMKMLGVQTEAPNAQTAVIGGSLYERNPKTNQWRLAVQGPPERLPVGSAEERALQRAATRLGYPSIGAMSQEEEDATLMHYYAAKRKQEGTPVDPSDVIVPISAEDTLWNSLGVLTTGPWLGGLPALGAETLGIDLPGIGLQQVVRNRQRFKEAEMLLTQALSRNPRFPEGERKWILDNVAAIQPAWWRSTTAIRTKMETLDKGLRRTLRSREALEHTEITLSIKQLLNIMGVPSAEQEQRGTIIEGIAPDGSRVRFDANGKRLD